MLKKMLVALDGSENAERALPWVKQYAERERAQVVLFRAVSTEHMDPEFIPSHHQDARNYLQRMETDLNYAGIPAKIVVKQGKPASEIVKAAVEEGCELILMATRGGSNVRRWAIGGVTEQTLRLSPVPVLVVQSRTALPKQGRVRRVIVPVDGSKLAEQAVPWTRELARLLKARIVFFHVYPYAPRGLRGKWEENFDALRKRMGRTCDLLREAGVKAKFTVRQGDPAEKILRFAGANDLIVTTTHGAGGFKRWIFGSVAEKLIHEATIPVLVYKTPAQAKEGVRVVAS